MPLRRLAAACSASRTRATAEKWALTRVGVIPNVSPSRSDWLSDDAVGEAAHPAA
jgi:hypothetical protein